jgi:hypothetical protein
LVRPVSTNGCEAWALIKTDKASMSTFERKILRKIYGPIQEREKCRIRYNHELYQFYKLPSTVQVIKIAWLQWAEHLRRMKTAEIPRKLMEWKPEVQKKCWTAKTSLDGRRKGEFTKK